jgi:hypothetical protein
LIGPDYSKNAPPDTFNPDISTFFDLPIKEVSKFEKGDHLLYCRAFKPGILEMFRTTSAEIAEKYGVTS